MTEKEYEKDMMDYIAMGKRIKDLRKDRGLTQENLAARTGLSSAHISNIETAHTKTSLTTLVTIANALSVSLDDIVCDSLANRMAEHSDGLGNGMTGFSMSELRIINDTLDALKETIVKNR